MKQFRNTSIWLVLFVAFVGFFLFNGCEENRLTPASAPETFACVPESKIEQTIAPEAQLDDFSCSYKKWEGAETLHFKVSIRNKSEKPQRFRVNIFLDNGKAVGGLIPRKTKKGLVKPNETGSFVYPVKGVAIQPKSIILKISTVGS